MSSASAQQLQSILLDLGVPIETQTPLSESCHYARSWLARQSLEKRRQFSERLTQLMGGSADLCHETRYAIAVLLDQH